MKRSFFVLLFTSVLIFLALSGIDATGQEKEKSKKEASLYDRLGGVYAIATVVDDFLNRVIANDILNANPAIKEARDKVPTAGLKYRVTELVCQVTGGPCKYTGRSMKDSHKHLNVTEKEWDALVVDFKASLAKFKVPEKEQQELLDIVGSTKKDIVVSSKEMK